MTRFHVNPSPAAPGLVVLPTGGFRRAKAEITAWSGYAPTPLRTLPALAREARVAAVALKDESDRSGLGGAYAVGEVVLVELARQGVAANPTRAELQAGRYDAGGLTVACAAEGGHGIGVAWAAQRLGVGCRIIVPEGADQARVAAMERLGGVVHRRGATLKDSLRLANEAAAREGWHVVADTSWPGYTEVPRLVMQGDRLRADEAMDQWTGPPPTHVFVQGGIAASVSVQLRARGVGTARIVVVEPASAAPLLASAARSGPATPCLLAWQELERAAAAFVAIDDPTVTAGLRAAVADAGLRDAIALGADSRVLLLGTEDAP